MCITASRTWARAERAGVCGGVRGVSQEEGVGGGVETCRHGRRAHTGRGRATRVARVADGVAESIDDARLGGDALPKRRGHLRPYVSPALHSSSVPIPRMFRSQSMQRALAVTITEASRR